MNQITVIENTTLAPLPTLEAEDILHNLLASKHSLATRKSYRYYIIYFCHYLITGTINRGERVRLVDNEVSQILEQYFNLSANQAIAYLAKYQSELLELGYSPNTINARVAAVKSLVRYAYDYGRVSFTLEKVGSLPPSVYRDTTGIKAESYSKMLALPDTDTLKGKRDYAILRLLWDNALRRSELTSLNVGDFDGSSGTLTIKGKGKLSREKIHLAPGTVEALIDWLDTRENYQQHDPLFIALDPNSYGTRLSGKSVYLLVRKFGEAVNPHKVLSPHRIRHSSITAVLDATDGNVRLAQKLSRHKNLNVLTVYDDNREELQKSASHLLASLV